MCDTRTVPCPRCNGTGHMDEDLAMEIAREERRPVCWMWGCEECDGRGTVEEEVEEEGIDPHSLMTR